MKSYLKRYKLSLMCKSPLHIGSGETIGKKEYILDRRNSAIYFPDTQKMIASLRSVQLLEKYEKFLLDPRGDLYFFLKDCNVSYGDWCGGPISVRGIIDERFNEISAFTKDPYRLPYIPGSSIKGSFRNVILNHEGKSRRKSGRPVVSSPPDFSSNKNAMAREAKRIEAEMLNTLKRNDRNRSNAVNDTMAAFRFSDSEPISRDAITICRKIDAPVKKKNIEPKRLPTYRESLKPGTLISHTLTVDTVLLKGTPYAQLFETKSYPSTNGESIEMYEFQAMLRDFNIDYTNKFRKNFSEYDSYSSNAFYIGGGTGFLTKTMLLGLLDDEVRLNFTSDYLNKRFYKHKHNEDRHLGISPHTLKLTEYNGKLYEMGKCELEIKEL